MACFLATHILNRLVLPFLPLFPLRLFGLLLDNAVHIVAVVHEHLLGGSLLEAILLDFRHVIAVFLQHLVYLECVLRVDSISLVLQIPCLEQDLVQLPLIGLMRVPFHPFLLAFTIIFPHHSDHFQQSSTVALLLILVSRYDVLAAFPLIFVLLVHLEEIFVEHKGLPSSFSVVYCVQDLEDLTVQFVFVHGVALLVRFVLNVPDDCGKREVVSSVGLLVLLTADYSI